MFRNILKKLLSIAARELVGATAVSAGTKIGDAIGHMIGKRIDPTWAPEGEQETTVEVVEVTPAPEQPKEEGD